MERGEGRGATTEPGCQARATARLQFRHSAEMPFFSLSGYNTDSPLAAEMDSCTPSMPSLPRQTGALGQTGRRGRPRLHLLKVSLSL